MQNARLQERMYFKKFILLPGAGWGIIVAFDLWPALIPVKEIIINPAKLAIPRLRGLRIREDPDHLNIFVVNPAFGELT